MLLHSRGLDKYLELLSHSTPSPVTGNLVKSGWVFLSNCQESNSKAIKRSTGCHINIHWNSSPHWSRLISWLNTGLWLEEIVVASVWPLKFHLTPTLVSFRFSLKTDYFPAPVISTIFKGQNWKRIFLLIEIFFNMSQLVIHHGTKEEIHFITMETKICLIPLSFCLSDFTHTFQLKDPMFVLFLYHLVFLLLVELFNNTFIRTKGHDQW